MGKLQVIGGLIGELGDRVLDWLENRSALPDRGHAVGALGCHASIRAA